MRADVAFETMERMLPYLSAIVNDEDGSALMRSIREKGKAPAGNVMQEMLPLFLGPHKEEKGLEMIELNAVRREYFVGDMVLCFGNCLTLARCM